VKIEVQETRIQCLRQSPSLSFILTIYTDFQPFREQFSQAEARKSFSLQRGSMFRRFTTPFPSIFMAKRLRFRKVGGGAISKVTSKMYDGGGTNFPDNQSTTHFTPFLTPLRGISQSGRITEHILSLQSFTVLLAVRSWTNSSKRQP